MRAQSGSVALLEQEQTRRGRDRATETLIDLTDDGSRVPKPGLRAPDLVIHRSARSRVKRVIDVVGAFIGLAVLIVLFPFVAIAIKVTSPGPVFFSQPRLGVGGRVFTMWKFRSMTHDVAGAHTFGVSDGFASKSKHDARITRVGRCLRSTSIDELPQVINVLKGDMSLVGTRPPTINEAAAYNAREWSRLQVKTGITGQWQVNGRSDLSDFSSVVELDLAYQREWSIAHDLRIIAATGRLLLSRRGAC